MVLCCRRGHKGSSRLVPALHQHKFLLRYSSISPELQHLHPSLSSHFSHPRAASASCPFPPSTSLCLSILPRTHPGCGCWVSAEPSTLQEGGAVALQRGLHCHSCTPTPPKTPWMGAQGLLIRLGTWHVTSLWEPWGWETHRAPHPGLRSTQENGKAGFYSDVAKE